MAELVLQEEEGADQEVFCGRDLLCEWEKNQTNKPKTKTQQEKGE